MRETASAGDMRASLGVSEVARGFGTTNSAAVETSPPIDEVDASRGQGYTLLGAMLRRAPGADLLAHLLAMGCQPSPLGLAHAALADAAACTDADRVSREYFDLFIGLGRGELLPYGSYYLTGFLHERPLARLRADLARLG